MEPLVLLYNLGPLDPVGKKLAEILEQDGIGKIYVGHTELAEKVGALLGIPVVEPTGLEWQGEIPKTQFMLLSGFDQERLDDFLAKMRGSGIFIPHKAILTWTNKDFSLGELIAEVEKEHATMVAQSAAK